jgi:hypothetical protein
MTRAAALEREREAAPKGIKSLARCGQGHLLSDDGLRPVVYGALPPLSADYSLARKDQATARGLIAETARAVRASLALAPDPVVARRSSVTGPGAPLPPRVRMGVRRSCPRPPGRAARWSDGYAPMAPQLPNQAQTQSPAATARWPGPP